MSTAAADLRIVELPLEDRTQARRHQARAHALMVRLGLLGLNDTERVEVLAQLAADPHADAPAARELTDVTNKLLSLLRPCELHGSATLLDLQKLLASECCSDGSVLESKLDPVDGVRTFDAHVTRALRAYGSGEMQFNPDLSKLCFDLTSPKLAQLREGFESGALTGIVLVAFPSEADLPRVLDQVQSQEIRRLWAERNTGGDYAVRTFTLESLRAMSVTEYLARHFEARGGKIFDRHEHLAEWAKLRWTPQQSGASLADLYWTEPDHATTYAALLPQATLGSMLGQASITFTHTRQVVGAGTPLPQRLPAQVQPLAQGEHLNYLNAMSRSMELLTPVEFFALLSQCVVPNDPDTYLNPFWDTQEWLSGITPSLVATAHSRSGYVYLNLDVPMHTSSHNRIRPVLRGAPAL